MNIKIPTKDDECRLLIKRFDDAIRSLADAVARQTQPNGPYSDEVYKAAKIIAKNYRAWVLVHALLTD